LFEEALGRGLHARIGKMSMDRNAPTDLLADPETDVRDIEHLIARWHGREGRVFVSLAPRFAPTCSDYLLAAHAIFCAATPMCTCRLTWLRMPTRSPSYVNSFQATPTTSPSYERHGLIGPRTLLGHCIHLTDGMIARLAASGAVAVHCPTSNLFLGSGLMPLAKLARAGCWLAIGSDIGAGTSLSPWRTLAAAAQIARLIGEPLPPPCLFWLATLGGAQALNWSEIVGNFTPESGRTSSPCMAPPSLAGGTIRAEEPPADLLSALIHHGDDRLTRRLYIAASRVHATDDTSDRKGTAKRRC